MIISSAQWAHFIYYAYIFYAVANKEGALFYNKHLIVIFLKKSAYILNQYFFFLVGNRSRGRPKGSLFNSYNTEV